MFVDGDEVSEERHDVRAGTVQSTAVQQYKEYTMLICTEKYER